MKSKGKVARRGVRATPASGSARLLRIVGGRHRGRRLRFPADTSIRPTPDRVRETLFNWLAPRISGAYCLDAFAGSGALGLEALSRGAGHVTFLERDRRAAEAIRQVLADWNETAADVQAVDTLAWLRSAPRESAQRRFDVVYLDPPFDAGVLAEACELLERAWLAPDARIYVERAARIPLPALPVNWTALRQGRAGEVGYHLFARRGAGNEGSRVE